MLAGFFGFLPGDEFRLMPGSVRALAHHQPMLVHDAIIAIEIGVGGFGLINFANWLGDRKVFDVIPRPTILPVEPWIGIRLWHDGALGICRVFLRLNADDPLVRKFVIVRMGDRHRTVCAGGSGNNHCRAHGSPSLWS